LHSGSSVGSSSSSNLCFGGAGITGRTSHDRWADLDDEASNGGRDRSSAPATTAPSDPDCALRSTCGRARLGSHSPSTRHSVSADRKAGPAIHPAAGAGANSRLVERQSRLRGLARQRLRLMVRRVQGGASAAHADEGRRCHPDSWPQLQGPTRQCRQLARHFGRSVHADWCRYRWPGCNRLGRLWRA